MTMASWSCWRWKKRLWRGGVEMEKIMKIIEWYYMLGSFYKIIYETLLTRNIILENELNFKVECNFFLLNSVFIKYFI